MICSRCGQEIEGSDSVHACDGTDAWGYALGSDRAGPPAPADDPPRSPGSLQPGTFMPMEGEYWQPPRHRGRNLVIALLVCVVLAGGVVAGVHLYPKHRSLDAVVLSAVQRTSAEKTARMSMDLSFDAGGQSLVAAGPGTIDFAHQAMQLDLEVSGAFPAFHMPLVLVDGTVYESVPDLGQIAPGKTWVSITTQSGSQSSQPSILGSGANPTGLVGLFAVPEASITDAGATNVDNVPTHGYYATFSETALDQARADPQVPAQLRSALADVIDLSGRAEIDQAGRLAEETVNMTINGDVPVTLSESLDFSGYGASVAISAPPASQVVPFPQVQPQLGGGGEQIV